MGISGSLRRSSRNTAALRWIGENLPDGTTFELADIGELPLYNWDVEQAGIPEAVADLADRVTAADAVLIATPEYNYSVTGALKNGLDWLSRPPKPMWGKPVAIFGVAGRSGSLRSQLHLREMLVHEEARIVRRPEVLITISDAFEGSDFVGDRAQEQLLRLVDALRAQVLHKSADQRMVLVVGREPSQMRQALRLLGEVDLHAVGAMTDDEAVEQIESGGFSVILIGGGVEESSRTMIKELAVASPEHLPCIDVGDAAFAARLALDAIHV